MVLPGFNISTNSSLAVFCTRCSLQSYVYFWVDECGYEFMFGL